MDWIWWGIILLLLIMIGVVITIVVLNRGNELDIINSLPSYRIYAPTGNVYMGVLNVASFTVPADGAVPVGEIIWQPVVNTNLNVDLNQWSFEPITTAFTTLKPNQKLVKMINRVYEATNIGYTTCDPGEGGDCNHPNPANAGFVSIQPGPGTAIPPSTDIRRRLFPTAPEGAGDQFIYTDLGNNLFTLAVGGLNVSIDAGGPYGEEGAPLTTWQLLPLN